MKKLIISAALLLSAPTWAADISLEGVTILGSKKTAYLMVDGEKQAVKIGDAIADWKVTDITPRMVKLRNAEGVEQEVGLHSQEAMPAEAAPANTPVENAAPTPQPNVPVDNPFTRAIQEGLKNGTIQEKPEIPPAQRFQPRQIPDDQIPPGHRRVRTPFGDILVKEQQAEAPSAPVATEAEAATPTKAPTPPASE